MHIKAGSVIIYMASIEVAAFFGLLIVLIQLAVDRASGFYLRNRRRLAAFSGGIALSYLALAVLPVIYQVQGRLSKVVFLSFLGSITLLFLIDRHIGSHRMIYKIKSEIREEHAVSLFVYNIIVGIAFIAFSTDFIQLLLFFVPVVLFTAFSSLSIREVYEIEKETGVVKLVLSGSTLIGILLATIIPISRLLYFPLLGFVGGTIFYIVLSDVTKEEKKSAYFFWGILIYTGLIGLAWWLF